MEPTELEQKLCLDWQACPQLESHCKLEKTWNSVQKETGHHKVIHVIHLLVNLQRSVKTKLLCKGLYGIKIVFEKANILPLIKQMVMDSVEAKRILLMGEVFLYCILSLLGCRVDHEVRSNLGCHATP